jgi:hypothetical protein
MNLGHMGPIAALAVCLSGRLLGQSRQQIRLGIIENLQVGNLQADIVSYLGRACVRIANTGAQDSGYGEGLAIVRGTSFRNGTIEVNLSGEIAPDAPPQLRGFVGIAFRVKDRSHFELFYIRTRNGRSENQLQRNHSTQYMSIPG